MAKYVYPAVFTEEKRCSNCKGGYTVTFPDWEGFICAATCGSSLEEAKYMATDLLNIMCVEIENDPDKGAPTPFKWCKYHRDVPTIPIEADTDYYLNVVMHKIKIGRYRRKQIWKALRSKWRNHVS